MENESNFWVVEKHELSLHEEGMENKIEFYVMNKHFNSVRQ